MRKSLPLLAALLAPIAFAAPSDDLLGYWTLDNNTTDSATGGSVTDNGSWIGSTSYNSSTAQFGSAANLNGSSYINIPTSSDLVHSGGDLSISVWCQVAAYNKNWQCLLSKGEGSNYRFARRSNDAQQIAYAGGSGDISGGAINDGNWHHVMGISEDGEITSLFVDGVLVATGPAPSLTDSGLPLLLGENPGNTGRQWNGDIDDVALFGSALSVQQAVSIYEFGTTYGYPMSDVIQIFDAHDSQGSTLINTETWTYQASDTGSGTFIVLGSDGSGVDVATGPAIISFTSSPLFITSGNSATLSWQITPPFTSVTIDQGVGNVLPQTNGSGAGSISVSPTVSTTYTISATNTDGTTNQTTTLFVDVDPSTPRINEFVADNSSDGLLDEDGDSSDWIEIYNPGPNTADLSTFYLSDDALSLNKWSFPAVIMPPNTYLVVFASSKNRAVAGSELHTNFKLSSGGEYLAISRDDGAGGYTVAGDFSPEYPSQEEGFSYGIAPDNITLGYLETPTPNAANGPVALGFVADTMFDIDRGFFTTPFNLSITSATVGAQIRYTTNGSEPTGTTGTVYTGPINISGTTTIRAAAFKAGYFETNVDTHTYMFLDDVRTQYANGAAPAGWPAPNTGSGQHYNYGMDPDITSQYTAQEMIDALSAIPSVSISLAQADFSGAGSLGINTNPGQHGKSWERAASLEIIHPDGTTQNVQSECGLRIRGGASRNTSNPKHALRLFFRNEYGDSKFEYPLFGAEGVDKFEKFDLRTAQNYSWSKDGTNSNTFIREVLGRDLQKSFGQPHTRSRYYHLYLNNVYWGLFMTQERAEANHGAAYLGGDSDSYDTLKSAGSSGGYNTEATDGDFNAPSDWNTLWNLAQAQEASPTTARFMQMQGLNSNGSRNPALPVYLDVNNLIDYKLITGYLGNYDGALSDFVGASNNWYSVRDRVRDEHGFQFFVHDAEHSMGAGGKWNGANDRMNTTNGSGQRNNYNKSNPGFLHFDLAESTEEYQLRFADRAHNALFNGGILTTSSVLDHVNARRSTVADVIIAESARWGDSKSTNPHDEQDWINAVNSLIGTVNGRTADFLGHVRTAGLYPDLDAPIYSQHGGVIASGSTINAIVPQDGTQLYYMIGTGDSDDTDWQDDLDPRLIGGTANSSASMINISGGGGGVSTTHYIQLGDSWKYLDNGSNQGTAWRSSSFNDNSWASGDSELGYGDGDEATVINDPGSGNRHATNYFRKTVTIPNPTVFGDFEIAITYDDSYAIYVNGNEVARHSGISANAPFNEYSSNTVGDNAIDNLTIPKTAFSAGSNTIAVEIHQTSNSSSDTSFNLRLTGRPLGGGNTVTIPIPQTITGPVWIKSRTYDSGTNTWSAMNQAFFSTAPPADAANIVISEVHYHPVDPTAAELAIDPTWDQDDFEFIEIMNTGTATLDLGGAALVLIPIGDHLEGVEFTFPLGTLIAPGERLVIAANSAAFAARYPGVTISGDYSGRLSNTGEWITLVNVDGNVIDSFRYNDLAPWPVAADGSGPSITRNSPASDPDPTLGTNWSAGPVDGSPGAPDGNIFTGNPLADIDGDGYVAIIEYAQGLSDNIFSAGQHIDSTSTIDVAGVTYPTVSYREDPSAIDANISIQVSSTLQTLDWQDGAPDLIFVSTTPDPDGIPRHTYRLNLPFTSTTKQFYRIKVTY